MRSHCNSDSVKNNFYASSEDTKKEVSNKVGKGPEAGRRDTLLKVQGSAIDL